MRELIQSSLDYIEQNLKTDITADELAQMAADLTINSISQSEWKTWQIGDEYYLKTNERSKMIKNIKIAKALYREGLTSEFLPIQTKSNDDYLDGEDIFLLTRKIGEPLNNCPLSDDEIGHLGHNAKRERNAYQLGQGIARLHKGLKSVQEEIRPDEMNLYQQGINAIPKIKKYNLDIKDDFYSDYIETFGKLYDKLPKQLIHGNPTGDSAVYENGEIVSFKGFEIYNISHIRLFDIVYSAGETNSQPDINLYLNTLKNIMKGYDSMNPLIKEEIESIYYVLCSIAMNMIVYCDEVLDVTKRNVKALIFLANNKEKFFIEKIH